MPTLNEEIEDLLGEPPTPRRSKYVPDTPKKLSPAAAALLGDDQATEPVSRHQYTKDTPKLVEIHRQVSGKGEATEQSVNRLMAKMADKMWRMESGMYLILNEKGKVEPFELRHEQRQFLKNRHFRNFVPKARKLGMSTLIVIDYLDSCLFTKNFRCGVIDLKQLDAEDKLSIAKFAWDQGIEHPRPEFRLLWQRIHARLPLVDATKSKLAWKNGAAYTAGTRYTGKNPHKLHCSEFGPIAAQFPRVAEDIVRGSFNSVPMGGTIDIETTMEGGRIGQCYSIFKLSLKAAGYAEHDELDWKIHFFSWLGHPSYTLPGKTEASLSASTNEYFAKLHADHGEWIKENFGFSEVPIGRRAWWEKKRDTLQDFMWQQFPTVVEECDMATVVGQIYPEITRLRADGRVTDFNPESFLPLVIAADLGSSANTALWLIQPAGKFTNVIDCAFGETASPDDPKGAFWVASKYREWGTKYGLQIEQVIVPHDAQITDKGSGATYVQNLVAAKVPQAKITVVPRTPDVWAGIDATRKVLPNCWFHSRCDKVIRDSEGVEHPSGLARLEGYRVKPPGSSGVVNDKPMHDICSHAADGFRTYGESAAQFLLRSTGESKGRYNPEEANAPEWWKNPSGSRGKNKVIMRRG